MSSRKTVFTEMWTAIESLRQRFFWTVRTQGSSPRKRPGFCQGVQK